MSAKNVGILALEVYTPSTFVTQAKLEEYSGVSEGRYTIGLGQNGLAVTGDAEDINSLCLTVVHSLLEKYSVDPNQVGRLEVGTETLVDKSKSSKTVLMDLFPGNTDMEGATIVNACYGGTAALLNAFLWVESDGWDGRYAIVVAADIAAYARGPARPTCGAGAVAVLIGRDAPLVFHPKERATHATNVWDFFKPDHTVEYPTVDGALSQTCYYQALEDVYTRFSKKMEEIDRVPFDAESPDYLVFHAPYNKLVQKSYARLFLMDARRKHALMDEEEKKGDEQPLAEWLAKPIEETYSDRTLEGVLKNVSAQSFKKRLVDANVVSKEVGNTYTASVFLGLSSLVDRVGGRGELTPGKTIVVFSYGSGALASMYRLHVREPTQNQFTIDKMVSTMKLTDRLASREEVSPGELDHALETRARMHRAGAPYSPVYPTIGRLFPGTYYLNGIDSKWTRTYSRVPLDAKMVSPGSTLAPPIVLRYAARDTVSVPVTGKLSVLQSADDAERAVRRIACVITGTAAGLPGGETVFSEDNLSKLIQGKQCITQISESTCKAMLEKNVVQTRKSADGTIKEHPVDSHDKAIKLAAQLGKIDLTASYGVPKGLAETMDIAAQVAVAAGMEALKSAGLVRGKSADPAEWKLPEQYRDTTGVVYASSFPAMDAAVGEVMRYLQSKTVGAADTLSLISALRARMIQNSDGGVLSEEDDAAFGRLVALATDTGKPETTTKEYVFDRKFLFRVLVLGNAQLAQLAGCRGPNTQTNAACAGTTQAIGMAQDMLISGRAERVVVVAGDNASGETLLPWLGSGFRALGAASTVANVEDAACPFDKRRSGMLLGAGAIGLVLETEASCIDRQISGSFEVKARLLATQYSNSAFHGAALDRKHIGAELNRFLTDVELIHGINRAEIATHGVYFSHETSTHASDASSCAGNEVAALRFAFGDELLSKMLIVNTKGFTGHPMGVSFEDVTAVEVLLKQRVPAVSNYKEHDPYLGDLNLSKGGPYACRYALRFAAGFGSQVAFALFATAQYE
ncbi:hydroxymethylglutaryl-CoA synthase [Fragilaria crotonensis]|nr:hydroxymethylglutaryl-CoA synthase [Fragilaria crotonensis]